MPFMKELAGHPKVSPILPLPPPKAHPILLAALGPGKRAHNDRFSNSVSRSGFRYGPITYERLDLHASYKAGADRASAPQRGRS